METLLGLAIGFAIGGTVLVHYLPQLQAYWAPTAQAPTNVAALEPIRIPSPASLPRVLAPQQPQFPAPRQSQPAAPPLPNIVQPDQPTKTAGVAGTGFFIATDGTLLTAAHVVPDCRRLQVVSAYVPLTTATVVASDHHDDIALLRAAGVRSPAILPLGHPAAGAGQVFVLGYPATAGPRIPAETWGRLENASLPAGVGHYADPGFMVWLYSTVVTHGFSGGPIVDPRDGDVVGLIKGSVDPRHLRAMPGMPDSNVDVGPGADRLIAFVQGQEPWVDVTQVDVDGDQTLDLARRATVHVLCWR